MRRLFALYIAYGFKSPWCRHTIFSFLWESSLMGYVFWGYNMQYQRCGPRNIAINWSPQKWYNFLIKVSSCPQLKKFRRIQIGVSNKQLHIRYSSINSRNKNIPFSFFTFNAFRPKQIGRYFANNFYKSIFFHAKGPVKCLSFGVHNGWCCTVDRSLPEPMMAWFTYIRVTRPQLVTGFIQIAILVIYSKLCKLLIIANMCRLVNIVYRYKFTEWKRM